MTRLFNDPARFADEMLEGFVDLYADHVRPVRGGVVRAVPTRPGKVAVVVGGGSGHYPAFCGVVGPGFADGAVVGNVFTSPSTAAAVSVARAADSGAGVVFTTGNYAGDVMNFRQAVAALEADGVAARYVLVTDDIASSDDHASRRGVAGDFLVFKVMGAAAEADYPLDEVVRVAERANDRTRSLGVAYAGCTLPGDDHPLFDLPTGRMGLGLGIHGEAGIDESDVPDAASLAEQLVTRVLADAPEQPGSRVAVVLNGLGSVKYEELFVVWRTAGRLLRDRGLELVRPEVGELVTSLDMAGVSLSVMWLDDELDALWRAPALTPAYRTGAISADRHVAPSERSAAPVAVVEPVSEAPTGGHARLVVTCLHAVADAMAEAETELGRLDAVAGDGDHGRGMVRGTSAAAGAAAGAGADATAGQVLVAAGAAFAAEAGGTSGVLWGAGLQAFGRRLGTGIDGQVVADAVDAALTAVRDLGGANPGDKTMVDALAPFAADFGRRVAAGSDPTPAWRDAAAVATRAAEATAALTPRLGRARPLAARSVGTPDPGATSLALALVTIGRVLHDATVGLAQASR